MFGTTQTDRELLGKGAEQCHFTSAILRGINHEDGREAGTPYLTDGDGNCMLNAVAMQFVKKQPRGVRNAVKTMAAQLRLGIVVEGLRNIEVYLDRQYEFYGTWYNYVDQVVFDLRRCGWVVDAMPEDRWRMASRDCARLVFLGCLHHIARDKVFLQQFVLPMLATVIRGPVRVFVPCEALNSLGILTAYFVLSALAF